MTRRRRSRPSCHLNVPQLLTPRATMKGLSFEVAALRPPVLILSTPPCQRRQLTSATRHRRSEDIPGLGGSMGMCVLGLWGLYVGMLVFSWMLECMGLRVCTCVCACVYALNDKRPWTLMAVMLTDAGAFAVLAGVPDAVMLADDGAPCSPCRCP